MSSTKLLRLPLKAAPQFSRVQIQPQTPLSRNAVHCGQLGPHTLLPLSKSAFSTRVVLLNAKHSGNESSRPRSDAEKTRSENVDPFGTSSVTLESLGIGKNMKIFLLAVLGVLGTIETWLWCKAIWFWWKRDGKDGEEAE